LSWPWRKVSVEFVVVELSCRFMILRAGGTDESGHGSADLIAPALVLELDCKDSLCEMEMIKHASQDTFDSSQKRP
jgi:hypothetical protein